MHTLIFDIDGTLADIAHRRHHVAKTPKDWRAFHAALDDDVPIPAVATLYRTLWESGRYDMQLLTGRNEAHRARTEAWLAAHDLAHHGLTMRADRDYRPDYVVKGEAMDRFLAAGKSILFAVDDRQQVVDMWRRRGVTCLQCDVGDF